ncbi:MAG: YjgN family protein [Azospirillaceae bacterium]|nr:YjgN family protein [Azospirillaceae bacterium]
MPDTLDASNTTPAVEGGVHLFRFHGRGAEYFSIWIVNLLLTIVTLGVYSPWAKVRTERYFHEATELAGARFGYHARPLSILIGRAIVLALFVPYLILVRLQSPFAALFALLLAMASPWLVVKALRFRLRVTSYRGVRFSFSHERGVMAGAYIRFLGLPILGGVSLGLLFPYVIHQQYRWMVDNSRFGATPMRMTPAVGRFYLLCVAMVAAFIVFGGAIAAIFVPVMQAEKTGVEPSLAADAMLLLLPVLYAALILTAVTIGLKLLQTAVERTTLGDVTFTTGWRVLPYVWLQFSNFVLLAVTLGFAYPWVRCRKARYILEHMAVRAPTGLDHFVAGATDETGAFGDQAASFFDIDLGIGF